MQKDFDKKLMQALAGQYQIDIKAALKEGWEMTKMSRGAMLQGISIVILISIVLLLMIDTFTTQRGLDRDAYDVQLVSNILITVLVAPFAAALVMMGVDTSKGRKIKFSDVFQFVSKTFVLTITALLTTAVVQIGLLFLFLPGLYMIIATGFAVPLVLDKKMLPAEAVLTSIRVVNHQWLAFVKLYAMFFVLLMLVALTFGIALIWVAPFYYNVKGVLYRDIFSTEETMSREKDDASHSSNTDDVFNA